MAITVLLGSRQFSWKNWLEANLGERPLLVLDPADTHFGPATRLELMRREELLDWRLVASITPTRDPMGILTAAAVLKPKIDFVAVLAPLTRSPIMRQLTADLCQVLGPSEILCPVGDDVDADLLPIGAATVELPAALPAIVGQAQRRARWIEAQQNASLHEVKLDEVTVLGAKLGSGLSLHGGPNVELGPYLHLEISDGGLFGVSNEPVNEGQNNVVLAKNKANKITGALTEEYAHVVCSLNKQSGEPVAIGFIERAEFARNRLIVRSDLVNMRAVRQIVLGQTRVDGEGRELTEVRPWSI